MIKILVAIPVYSAMQPRPLMSVIMLARHAAMKEADRKYSVRWSIYGPKVKTVTARESASDIAISNNADYLMFIDDDMVVPSDCIDIFLIDSKDIVGGIFFKPSKPIEPLIFRKSDCGEVVPYYDYPRNSLFEVDAIGTGLLMIKTDVLKQMAKPIWVGSADPSYAEDINFCRRAKESGFSIWCDSRVKASQMSLPLMIGETQYDIIENQGVAYV